MEIILTHEQADFDALASLLGAHLLMNHNLAVLPKRVNRNAREFLNLYLPEIPFVEQRDLGPDAIQQVTLVDTQSLVTLRGLSQKTRVRVIDHHDLKGDLPAGWEIQIEKVGAATTIFVDLLREHNHSLAMIQATLLLLGIYEDTGSLTYVSTTVRDVKAAAYLLEKGASLSIAAEYLNPSLSEGQKRLADILLGTATTHTINGKTIIVAHADALNLNEEISSIAHKLRDLLDPDALFLLVQTSEGIRLVARSTSDRVNVAKVAQKFGGGGHERAAAALLQIDNRMEGIKRIDEITVELLAFLKENILPSVTVSRIMSKRPHLISPSASLEDALSLMQKYGYEGYPVVENDRVVGLLTRRAVDRAVSHKLKRTVGSLMEAGEHTLHSDDTIDQLQNLMSTTGWGQIPVTNPESGKIIGIVTRTDLLKALPGHVSSIARQANYAKMLDTSLSPAKLALLKLIADFSRQEHLATYVVGGFVRDLILNVPSTDFDIVVEGDALLFSQSLAKKYGGRVVSHHRFGTAKWQLKQIRSSLKDVLGIDPLQSSNLPDSVDFISARTEFYDHPSALPTVERSSIKLDLHRRDFTINTLALRLDGRHYGELYDYWGGLTDIEKKQVRVLHSLSFVDDPTRLLRAVRFEQRFNFTIEKRTQELMKEARELLVQLSGERIKHEFDLIFEEKDPVKILSRFESLNLLCQIHPALNWDAGLDKPLMDSLGSLPQNWGLPSSVGNSPIRKILPYLVWLCRYEPKISSEIADRLRLPKYLTDTLAKCSTFWMEREKLLALAHGQLTFLLEQIPSYGVFALYCLSDTGLMRSSLELFSTSWRLMQPRMDGNTLKEMGVPLGPKYSRILLQIREAWIDGTITSEAEEKALLEKILKSS